MPPRKFAAIATAGVAAFSIGAAYVPAALAQGNPGCGGQFQSACSVIDLLPPQAREHGQFGNGHVPGCSQTPSACAVPTTGAVFDDGVNM
jgi:hypothetical protein